MAVISTRDAAIKVCVDRYRALGSELYALSEARVGLRATFRKTVEALFANAPQGLRQMTVAALAKPGNRFALIDIAGPKGTCVNGDSVVITTYQVRLDYGLALVENEDTGEVVGQICAESKDWIRDVIDSPVQPWRAPYFYSSASSSTKVLLPIQGEPLRHGAYRRMAEYAKRVLRGEAVEIERMRGIDAEVARLKDKQEALTQQALEIATRGFDLANLDVRHADIIAMMGAHDWTYHYADRPSNAAYQHEQRMLAALAAIPEDEAIALWHRYSWSPMNERPWSFVKRETAPRRAA